MWHDKLGNHRFWLLTTSLAYHCICIPISCWSRYDIAFVMKSFWGACYQGDEPIHRSHLKIHSSQFSRSHFWWPKPESPAFIVSNRPVPCGATSSLPSFSMEECICISVSCVRWDQHVDRISGICPKLPTQSSLATMFSKLTAFETCKWRGETLVRCGRFSQFSQVRVSKRWSCDLIRFRCCWPTRWLPQGIQFW